MRIEHDSKADAIYIRLNKKPFHRNKVLANSTVVLDLAEDDTVIGIELISPSRYIDNLDEIIYELDGKAFSIAQVRTTTD
jgi:uncharacterized protein YuzE